MLYTASISIHKAGLAFRTLFLFHLQSPSITEASKLEKPNKNTVVKKHMLTGC